MIQSKTYISGPLEVNSVIIYSDCAIIVVDPGADMVAHIRKITERESIFILLTHGHIDHLAGITKILEAFPEAKVCINKKDMPLIRTLDYQAEYLNFLPVSPFVPDMFIEGDGTFSVEDIEIYYFEIGGHTAGSTAFVIDGIIYSGDTLFNYAVGRTDLMGSTSHQELLANIRTKLMSFPDATKVVPGHGPATTIGFERSQNLYVASRDNG